MSRSFLIALCSGWLGLVASARAELLINEVLYDPEGADAGREFVEIANTGRYGAALEGLTLEAGDGARPDDWKVVWRGGGGRWIAPGGTFRVGLDGPGDGEPADLGLQNGPDAVRLRKLDYELDRVGWGAHELPEYFEARPCPVTKGGQSLARREDGVDTDDNATDFEVAVPTPGRPNHPRIDWAVSIATPLPELPQPGSRYRLPIRMENRGREAGDPPVAELIGAGPPLRIGWPGSVAPGEAATETLELTAPSDTGFVTLEARRSGSDAVPENDRAVHRLRVGRGSVRVTEVLSAPDGEDGEWIEVRLDAVDGTVLTGLRFELRGRSLDLRPRRVEASTRWSLVVEDSTAMRRRFPELSAEAFWGYDGRWTPLLNQVRGRDAPDTLRIRDAAGGLLEIAMPGPSPAPSVSLERIDVEGEEGPFAWAPSVDPGGGTPGRPGPSAPRPAREPEALRASPRSFRPGPDACRFDTAIGGRPGAVRLCIVNLRSEPVVCPVEDLWVVGSLLAGWDGKDGTGRPVDPGIYIAVLEIRRGKEPIERRRIALAVAPPGDP